jgi:hypothetical protein
MEVILCWWKEGRKGMGVDHDARWKLGRWIYETGVLGFGVGDGGCGRCAVCF